MKSFQHFLITLFFVVVAKTIIAQPFFTRYDSIPVSLGGPPIVNPWAGGLNFIQSSSVIDLNQDGIKDLFTFDRTGDKIRCFINHGTANTVDYKYDASYEAKFPKLQQWAVLVDYNNDGKEDIFSYSWSGGGMDIYKNISSVATGLQFQLVKRQVRSMYNPPSTVTTNLYISSVDVPAITDIDNDGDIDVVTFAITGTYMEYHINKSMEMYGVPDSLVYEMKNRCWGYAAESPLSNTFHLNDVCSGNVPSPGITIHEPDDRSVDRHSGGCELCIDLDNDADKEIIVGGISYPNLTMLTNGGRPDSAVFVAKDTAFPSNNASTVPVELTLFPCAYYLDVNNDGLKDLIVSPNAPNASENFNSEVYYKNTGTNSFPVFVYQQANLIQDGEIEVGEGAYPVFFDYDNDGLKDLFIGNYGYYGASAFQHQISQYRNTGTATNPQFTLITRDYMNLSTFGITNMVPAFGDMDGDGDADMFIGDFNGKMHYFKNTAPAGGTANFVLTMSNFKNSSGRVIDVGDYNSPQIVDVDGDGKNDLVIGARNGKLAYYHHSGSATASIPVMDSISHFFGQVKVNQHLYFTGYSFPFVFKQAGVTKLLCGSEQGYLHYYDNIDGNLTGTFNLVDSMYLNNREGASTALSGADINNDGLMDFVIGNYSGGVSFFKGVNALTTSNELDNFIHWNLEVYPNPANNMITIHMLNDQESNYEVELYNIMGQVIFKQRITSNSTTINSENLGQGIYICKVREINAGGKVISGALTKKIIVKHN